MRLLSAWIAGAAILCAQSETAFRLSGELERTRIWGGPPAARTFLAGNLPALFTRTLEFDAPLPSGSTLEWIFTGDEGGVTVRLSPGVVRLTQRYYDSFGHSSADPPKARYPERVWDEEETPFEGEARSLSVSMDDKLSVTVAVNGQSLIRQTCLMEVRRQQLGWTAGRGEVSGRMLAPAATQSAIRVDASQRRQKIIGFGGIVSAPAYSSLSTEGKQRWWNLVKEYNVLIHREYPNGVRLKPDLSNFDRIEDATQHYYGDNFPNGEISDFDYIRQLRAIGGKVWFEFWELPPWARRPGSKEPLIDEYVRAVVGYCKVAWLKTGKPPDVVGIQNEVVQESETWRTMVTALRTGLDAAGFQAVQIHMPDNGRLKGGIATAKAIRAFPEAWKAIDFAATHVYDFQQFYQDPDGYDALINEWREAAAGKAFLSTELTVNSSAYQSRSYRVAFAQALLYHKNMALMDASALAYCWLLLDVEQPIFGATRSLWVADRSRGYAPVASSYQLRTFGAYSRRLMEGMVRVEAASDTPDLLVTAYEGPAGRTIVLINRSTIPREVKMEWPGSRLIEVETASVYQENTVRHLTTERVPVQPGEVVTVTNVALRR